MITSSVNQGEKKGNYDHIYSQNKFYFINFKFFKCFLLYVLNSTSWNVLVII